MAWVLGTKRRKERCPMCRTWLHVVRLAKRFCRTMFCPKCGWIGLSDQDDGRGMDVVGLVKEYGVDEHGKLKRPQAMRLPLEGV